MIISIPYSNNKNLQNFLKVMENENENYQNLY